MAAVAARAGAGRTIGTRPTGTTGPTVAAVAPRAHAEKVLGLTRGTTVAAVTGTQRSGAVTAGATVTAVAPPLTTVATVTTVSPQATSATITAIADTTGMTTVTTDDALKVRRPTSTTIAEPQPTGLTVRVELGAISTVADHPAKADRHRREQLIDHTVDTRTDIRVNPVLQQRVHRQIERLLPLLRVIGIPQPEQPALGSTRDTPRRDVEQLKPRLRTAVIDTEEVPERVQAEIIGVRSRRSHHRRHPERQKRRH
ncbi:hypothetical protein MSEN_26580 [Mycolicibacter senuensis]|uniref:Uncharacterized protein n=1 Tax=Mycolicibacter senuensis TaxID=386913 RepID=A0A7I9XMJ4_9MYCO|nr:hypothetical protein MSEN_26580 [Mycolicibacter senuensis]